MSAGRSSMPPVRGGRRDRGGQAGGQLPCLPSLPRPPGLPCLPYWNRDEWDVSLSDGGVYRIFRDRETDGWFIDGIFD